MSATINQNGLLAGKVAVVTGASRGIGEAIAIRYAMEGAKVVVSARTVNEGDHVLPGSINEVVKRINDAGGSALAVRADLGQEEHRVHLIEAAEEAFGAVDILVNNAAVTYFIAVTEFSEKRYKLMMEVQVYGPFHLAQLVLGKMRERNYFWFHLAFQNLSLPCTVQMLQLVQDRSARAAMVAPHITLKAQRDKL